MPSMGGVVSANDPATAGLVVSVVVVKSSVGPTAFVVAVGPGQRLPTAGPEPLP